MIIRRKMKFLVQHNRKIEMKDRKKIWNSKFQNLMKSEQKIMKFSSK